MHTSVLLDEVLESLDVKENGIYVDCTLGYAGHSEAILRRIKKGKLYAFDQDKDAVIYSTDRLSKVSKNFEIINNNFVTLKDELNKRNITKVNGILFDLGVSSPQLDEAKRGFSYHNDSILDMRMDQNSLISALEAVNNYSYHELVKILYSYGEEKYAKQIARNIEKARLINPIKTTLDLVDIIKCSVPEKYKKLGHPARKTFQAIRIEVNKELEVFEKALIDAIDMLEIGGVICVITFHSLEDRICKNIFNKYSEIKSIYKGMPNIPLEYTPILELKKKIKPSNKEIVLNNRARSALLRVAIKKREVNL